MPKYVIERQYLVPMYQQIVIEAENLEKACKKAISDGYDVDHFQRVLIASRDPRGLPLDMLSLATFLYEHEGKTGPRLEIPAEFTDSELPPTPPSAAVEGLGASEPSGHRDRVGNLSKNRLAVLGTAYVGVLSRERGSSPGEFNPCACSHQYGLSPLHAEACGG